MTTVKEKSVRSTKSAIKKAATDGRKTRTKRKTAEQHQERTAWTGLSKEEAQQPGALLLYLLFNKANEVGLNLTELAQELGVTYGYLSQLRKGMRQTRNVSDEFSQNCATFLGLPRIAILLASGRVQFEDFFEDPAMVRDYVSNAMAIIRKDPDYGPLLPGEIETTSYENQRLIALLYQQATGIQILPEAVDQDAMISQLKRLNAKLKK